MTSLRRYSLSSLTLFSFSFIEARKRRRAVAELTLDELKKEDRVNVHVEPMCIFLFRDGNFSLPYRIASFPYKALFVRHGHIVQLNAKP
jgi:hypothetical protein